MLDLETMQMGVLPSESGLDHSMEAIKGELGWHEYPSPYNGLDVFQRDEQSDSFHCLSVQLRLT